MTHEVHELGPPRNGEALEWPDEQPPEPNQAGAQLELQRRFWAKVAPPIYDTRAIDYSEPKLVWE